MIVIIIIILIIWTLIEQKLLMTTKYSVSSNKLPKAFDGSTYVILADLHNYKFGKKNKRLVKRINALAPDFIIIAGDMINKSKSCYPSNVFDLLEALARKYPIYYGYGNHEQRLQQLLLENSQQTTEDLSSTWVEFKDLLQKLKVIFLDNESSYYIKNNEKLRITGVSIGKQYFERNKIPSMDMKYLESLIGKCPMDQFQILIAHNPVFFETYAGWGADLTISGHLHGGMVRLPGVGGVISPQVKLFPKYYGGNYSEHGREMLVSRGLGSHSYMPRLFNIPELVFVTMKYKR